MVEALNEALVLTRPIGTSVLGQLEHKFHCVVCVDLPKSHQKYERRESYPKLRWHFARQLYGGGNELHEDGQCLIVILV